MENKDKEEGSLRLHGESLTRDYLCLVISYKPLPIRCIFDDDKSLIKRRI